MTRSVCDASRCKNWVSGGHQTTLYGKLKGKRRRGQRKGPNQVKETMVYDEISGTLAGHWTSELQFSFCTYSSQKYNSSLRDAFATHKAFSHIFINIVSLKWLAINHTWENGRSCHTKFLPLSPVPLPEILNYKFKVLLFPLQHRWYTSCNG